MLRRPVTALAARLFRGIATAPNTADVSDPIERGTLCSIMAQKHHFSLRLPEHVLHRLEEQAAARGSTKTSLAETYVSEAVASADHPGIVFRDGPAGRRPGVVGGPDVWEVIETFLGEGRDEAATARYLSLPVGLVQAAAGYYAQHQEEIDAWIDRNAMMAAQARATWERAHKE